ncbi:MAG: hypothetical protein OEO79_09410 [Gemmatimonadota bacterium]|nr:hypothetical protein [Gemmatimonadota bacterium]
MIKRVLPFLVLVGIAAPDGVASQGLAAAARVGTFGLGGEVAMELSERVVLRGGIGIQPYEPSMTFSDIDVSLKLPTVYNVGLDLYVNGAVRLGGGLMFRTGDPEVTGKFTAAQEIGGTSFTPQEIGTLRGVLDANDSAPYIIIGFGRHTARGVGLFLDLGLAFTGNPNVLLSASGGSLSGDADPLRSALAQEAEEFEADMRGYLKVWPVLSLGIRLGAQ